MKKIFIILFLSFFSFYSANAVEKIVANPQIDARGFQELADEALKYRETRRVDLTGFIEMAKDKDTIILDARSKRMYDLKHVKNAINLNFSEFSVNNLAEVIPSKDTRILIYCNNNFSFNSSSPAFFEKKLQLSLNVPTFINLYGYGYKNVYELGPVIDEKNTELKFDGTEIKS